MQFARARYFPPWRSPPTPSGVCLPAATWRRNSRSITSREKRRAAHRLENPGKIQLELIEVKTGIYLAEDDISRIEDDYRRS